MASPGMPSILRVTPVEQKLRSRVGCQEVERRILDTSLDDMRWKPQ